MAQTLHWVTRCAKKELFRLNGVKLSTVNTSGVYVIFTLVGYIPKVIRVGQGDIAQRLQSHREDAAILQYGQQGTLYVAWATTLPHVRNGIERYLGDQLKPAIGTRFPDVVPIAVNDPFENL